MSRRNVLFLGSIALSLLFARTTASGDGNWPREVATGSVHLVMYQPQVESWKDNRIEARSAMIVTRKEAPTQIFGTVSISARTDVDQVTRLVSFEDIVIRRVTFPARSDLQPMLLKAVRESVPGWPQTVSLDRLLADLAITQAGNSAEPATLKNDPPKILFSDTPAVLILIDGQPVYRPAGTGRWTRVINTPALLLFDPAEGRFYLDGPNVWMTATQLQGPWTVAGQPPADLDTIREQLMKDEDKDPGAPAAPPPSGKTPAVYVSTVPAELLVTRGAPEYAPLAQTGLLYVRNSDNDIFMETRSQQFYTLLAGRWFRAKSLSGPWTWVAGSELPHDFSRITPESIKGHVLASLPGTEQAREAAIANQVPQTATVRRSEARLTVKYAGPPTFEPVVGTPMEYAVNTSAEVIHAQGRYYAVQHGVWFVADAPLGPWKAADTIPAVIYTIPPSSPLYHVRFVYVYGATPEVVYVGYTPGYLGSFVSGGVVVFGTGWSYPGLICGDYWCGWPWTWGLGFQFSYWGGGWIGRPLGSYWWYHSVPAVHRVFYEHWNPRSGSGSPSWVRGNVNAYSHWAGPAVAARSVQPHANVAPLSRGTLPDVYSGRNGQVYEHRPDGWYSQGRMGEWQKTPANPSLEQDRRARALGQSRQREFEHRGYSPSVPRTAPSPRSAPAPRGRVRN